MAQCKQFHKMRTVNFSARAEATQLTIDGYAFNGKIPQMVTTHSSREWAALSLGNTWKLD